MRKDELLERLVFSDAALDAYAKAEIARTEHRDHKQGDHWSRPVLLERAAYLRKLARFSEGSASETIREVPGYCVMLTVLLRSGDAITHEKHAEILIVLDGQASLVSGGTLERAKHVSAEETRGIAISAGSTRDLRPGDVIHLAAGTPHQLLLADEKTLSCLVLRVKEIVESR